jgi:uncharacterized protein YcgI (DUF1989 family)
MSSRQTLFVPGYEGRAVRVAAGSTVRVIDVEGCQIGDLFVLVADNLAERLSPAVTRLINFTPFPQQGAAFYSNRRRRLLTLLEDTSPGRHDMTFAPCDSELYRDHGAGDHHPNCRDNFFQAMRAIGLTVDSHPDPINVFQNTPINAEGSYTIGPALSRAGDTLTLRADADLILALTACSVDIPFDGVQANGGRSTPLRLDIAW